MPKTYNEFRREKGMKGPFSLDSKTVAKFPDDAYGVYLLGAEAAQGQTLLVIYVGRGVFKDRLLDHLRTRAHATHFWFKQLPEDDEVGFKEECRLFHDYDKRPHLDNKIHPRVPDDAPKTYPRCSERGCKGEPD